MAKVVKYFLLITTFSLFIFYSTGQEERKGIRLPAIIEGGDTIPYVVLPEIYIYPVLNFTSKKQEEFYWKTVRDVKRTLPYAKAIAATYRQVVAEMEGMSEAERSKYMKSKENDLVKKYEPELKKLTLSQGKLLIRLVDRECERTSYQLIKDYRGGFRAFFWQGFARLLGADLKSNYEKEEKDRIIERVINLVEAGQL